MVAHIYDPSTPTKESQLQVHGPANQDAIKWQKQDQLCHNRVEGKNQLPRVVIGCTDITYAYTYSNTRTHTKLINFKSKTKRGIATALSSQRTLKSYHKKPAAGLHAGVYEDSAFCGHGTC